MIIWHELTLKKKINFPSSIFENPFVNFKCKFAKNGAFWKKILFLKLSYFLWVEPKLIWLSEKKQHFWFSIHPTPYFVHLKPTMAPDCPLPLLDGYNLDVILIPHYQIKQIHLTVVKFILRIALFVFKISALLVLEKPYWNIYWKSLYTYNGPVWKSCFLFNLCGPLGKGQFRCY